MTAITGIPREEIKFMSKAKAFGSCPAKFQFWVTNNAVCLIPDLNYIEASLDFRYHHDDDEYWGFVQKIHPSESDMVCIPIEAIQYYQIQGQILTETHVSGGGGGGSNLKGAVIGGVLAGGVGAVVGSRQKIEPIKSWTETVDKRTVYLVYTENEQSKSIALHSSVYDYLQKKLPEKDISYIQINSKEEKSSVDSISELKKYKELFDSGIITEEEFAQKKRQILNL